MRRKKRSVCSRKDSEDSQPAAGKDLPGCLFIRISHLELFVVNRVSITVHSDRYNVTTTGRLVSEVSNTLEYTHPSKPRPPQPARGIKLRVKMEPSLRTTT